MPQFPTVASSLMKVLLVTIKVSVYIVPQGCCAMLVVVFVVIIARWDDGLLPFFLSLEAYVLSSSMMKAIP